MAANPVLVQSNSSASSAAAPTSYTHTFAQASAAGTTLIVYAGYAQSAAASFTLPAGWVFVLASANAGNTIGGSIIANVNNPGGISSLALTSLVGINGIAIAMQEWSNMAVSRAGADTNVQGFSNSSAAPSAAGVAPTLGNELWAGLETDLTGQAYTPANLPAGFWIAGPTATSTVGATNAVLRSFYALPGPVPPPGGKMQVAGSLAGALANGVVMVPFITSNASALLNAATGMGTDVLGGQAISVGGA